jgi:hypothetical protein
MLSKVAIAEATIEGDIDRRDFGSFFEASMDKVSVGVEREGIDTRINRFDWTWAVAIK